MTKPSKGTVQLRVTMSDFGWRNIFFQLDFIASVLFLIAALLLYPFDQVTTKDLSDSNMIPLAIQLGASLLALVLASFTMFSGIGGGTLMKQLGDSSRKEVLARFVWASLLLGAAAVFGMAEQILLVSLLASHLGGATDALTSLAKMGFYVVAFLMFYGVFAVISLATITIRKLAGKPPGD